MNPQLRPLFEAATQPYAGAGTYAWRFARGKLRHDPVFFFLLRRGLLPDRESLLDLGCGRGILLSLLKAAKEQYRGGLWPGDWPAPPLNLGLRGIELSEHRVQVARRALGGGIRVDLGDLRDLDFQPCSVIVILDVLLYLERKEQQRLIEKAAGALEPGGLLLLREADAGAGFAFQATKWSERVACALRGEFGQQLHYRSAVQWIAELVGGGFSVRAEPMSEGTPFANVLFVARKGVAVDAVTREPCSAANSLLAGKNTGNFAHSAGSNQPLFLVNQRPEPMSSHYTCFRHKSERGINRECIRELAGT